MKGIQRVKVISDGTPGGTQVLMADGSNIAALASRVEIVIEPGQLVTAKLTFEAVKLDVLAEIEEAQP